MQQANISVNTWYDEAQSRGKWFEAWNEGVAKLQLLQNSDEHLPPKEVECCVCGRYFRRESDKTRHKCINEREKPIHEQAGAIQCQRCERWFKSSGRLAVHRCTLGDSVPPVASLATSTYCAACDRHFSRPDDLKRHKCITENRNPLINNKEQFNVVNVGNGLRAEED